MKTTCAPAVILSLVACDSNDPVLPPDEGTFSAAALDGVASPEVPPSSINQAVTVALRLTSDTGEAVRVERSCGGVLADVQKEEDGAWPTVGTTGCGDEDEPLVVADGDSTGLNHAGGAGFGDLYTSTREEAGWGTPEALGSAVNTALDEFHASLSPDRRLLLFVRRDPNAPAAHGDLHVVSWPLP